MSNKREINLVSQSGFKEHAAGAKRREKARETTMWPLSNAGKHANASSEERAEKRGEKCNCMFTRSPDLASQNSHVNVPKRRENANASGNQGGTSTFIKTTEVLVVPF